MKDIKSTIKKYLRYFGLFKKKIKLPEIFIWIYKNYFEDIKPLINKKIFFKCNFKNNYR